MAVRRAVAGKVLRPSHQLNKNLIDDFVAFCQVQYDCLDYDPFHPAVINLGRGLDREAALWLSVLYMAFYNLGSTWVAFANTEPMGALPDWIRRLPVGLQRRNLRGGKVVRHLEEFARLAREHGGLYEFLTKGFVGDTKKDWDTLKLNVGEPWGNGRWSIYTTSELFQKANNLPVWPCDIMNEDSSGPAAGLALMFQVPEAERTPEVLNPLADEMFTYLRKRITTNIPYLPKNHFDYAMVESELCDFQSLCKGRYYVGRDIDRDQERIVSTETRLAELGLRFPAAQSTDRVWDARAEAFEHRYLGEFNDWSGRTPYALQYYKTTGEIADHKTIRARYGFIPFKRKAT